MTSLAQPRRVAWRARAIAPIVLLDVAGLFVFGIAVPGFATLDNLRAVVVGALPLLALALGQTYVLITAGIDLSAPAVVGLASVAGGVVMHAPDGSLPGGGLSAAYGLAAMAAAAVLTGLLNGVSVGVLRMPAFMVTLGTGMFAGGLAVWLSRRAAAAETMYNLPGAFTAIGNDPAYAAALTLVVAVLAHVLLVRTRFGRSLQAVGFNARAALVSGVPVAGVVIGAYVVSATAAAVAAILVTGALETASPAHGRPLLLDVIGATVLGGTSLAGGRGSVAGTILGVAFLAMLGNALTLLNLSEFVIAIAKGVLILAAALADRVRGGAGA